MRRPQPNQRRGLLRAGIAVVVLLAILLAALLIVSSLTAPAANAPAPTPPLTPVVRTPPSKTPATIAPKGTPRPTPRHTGKPGGTSKDVSLGTVPLAHVAPSAALRNVAAERTAYFSSRGNAYRGSALYVRLSLGTRPILVGEADRYVRPVWSPDHSRLLYVRVAPSSSFPGARWTLLSYDVRHVRSTRLAQANGMGIEALGWRHGTVLYALLHSSGTDTSVFAVGHRHNRFLSIVTTQPVTGLSLSPDGRWIAYLTPAGCTYCTLDVFDVSSYTTWYGPSGVRDEHDLAWTADSRSLVTRLANHLAAIALDTHVVELYALPRSFPQVLPGSLDIRKSSRALSLRDRTTGRLFSARSTGAGS